LERDIKRQGHPYLHYLPRQNDRLETRLASTEVVGSGAHVQKDIAANLITGSGARDVCGRVGQNNLCSWYYGTLLVRNYAKNLPRGGDLRAGKGSIHGSKEAQADNAEPKQRCTTLRAFACFHLINPPYNFHVLA
jgi:hypothetical protein